MNDVLNEKEMGGRAWHDFTIALALVFTICAVGVPVIIGGHPTSGLTVLILFGIVPILAALSVWFMLPGMLICIAGMVLATRVPKHRAVRIVLCMASLAGWLGLGMIGFVLTAKGTF